jgi:hypothetical protein
MLNMNYKLQLTSHLERIPDAVTHIYSHDAIAQDHNYDQLVSVTPTVDIISNKQRTILIQLYGVT